VIFAASLAAAACGDPDPDTSPEPPPPFCEPEDPAPPADPRVLLGRLEGETFVELVSPATLQLHRGSQGGQHFFVSVRAYAPAGVELRHDIDLIGLSDRSLIASRSRIHETCAPGWSADYDLPIILRANASAIPPAMLEARTTILDAQGETIMSARAECEVVLMPPE
jgi:hypothetical protein